MIQRLMHLIVSMILVAILGFILAWPSLMTFAVDLNLDEYSKSVRGGSCSIQEKERLLDLIDGLKERIDDGASISTFRWMRHDQAIQPLLEGGLTSDDARLLEREFLIIRGELAIEKERIDNP
jgi:hypothetical protein